MTEAKKNNPSLSETKGEYMKDGFTRAERMGHLGAYIDFIGYMLDLWTQRDFIGSENIKALHDMLDRAKKDAFDLADEVRREEQEGGS